MKAVVLINPNIVAQRSDPFTTGIPFMPLGLAYAAGALRKAGRPFQVIDAFGEAPTKGVMKGGYLVQGLSPADVFARVDPASSIHVFYAGVLASHTALVDFLAYSRQSFPNATRVVLENTQAVTAYALATVGPELFEAGATVLLTGEPEERLLKLLEAIDRQEPLSGIDGLYTTGASGMEGRPAHHPIKELESLAYPAWDLFPVKNYWALGYSHGPVQHRFLPLLTSRGCPYPCRFCVVPSTNQRQWRPRQPLGVVNEIAHWQKTLGVSEFHWEDLNPTIQDGRIREIAQEICRQGLSVTWKLVAGTKLETLSHVETLEWMAKAGCNYISYSPESGSTKVLQAIDKSFDFDHAEKMTREMNRVGIRCQACFVLGFPGETDDDRALTRAAVKRLVRAGLDEIALFIITPVPGSTLFSQFSGYDSLSQLNFSPTWRSDYAALNHFRLGLYRSFLLWKLIYSPGKLLRQPLNFIRRRFETKMEMTPYRALMVRWRMHRAQNA